MSIIQSHASYPLASVILEVQMVTDFLFLQFRSTSSVALSASVDLVFKALGVILLCPMDSSPSLSITSKAVDVLERILSFFPRRIVSVEQVILHQKIIEGLIGLANGNNSYDSLEHAFQAAKLLENLLAVLLVDISLPRNKDSLSDASVFDAIGSLALKAIRHVLTHVPGCRQSFADMLGYHEIFERFRRRNLITDAFVTEFVDTICDRRPYNLTVFRDASSLEALLQLYTKFEPGHQLFIINKLAEACQSDITNFQIARKVRLLRFLLSVALPLAADEEHAATVVRLIKRLISFSSDVADAKALLMALKHRDGSQAAPSHSATATPGISDAPDHEPHRNSLGAYFLPFLHDEILRALVEAVQTNGASEHLDFFVFSQPHSGIVLPRIPRWPESPAKGYSLYISFRLSTEAFAVTVPSVLIAFAAESGSGMQLSIDSGMLVYTIVTKTDTVHTAKPQEIHVDPDTWYSVVVSHQVGMFNVSTATIHVNGACAWRGSMPFPHGEDSLRGVIGSRGAYDKDSYKPTDYFPGHVSSFALFNVVLSAEIIQSLHFGGEENLPIQPDLYNFQLLPPQQQPLLFAHPLAVKGSVCFNVSTHELAANQSPIVLHDVTCCSTRSFADALQSLGGIELLYPLLCQASLPVASIPQGSSSTAERLGPSIFYTSSPEERIVFVLSMICGMLSQNAYHMNRFVESDGVRLLSLLLQQSCLPCLSIRIFREILKLRRIPNASAELVNAVDEYLVFDPQIWSHAGQDVQRDYFAEIKALLAANTTGDLSQKYDIAFWLDAVEQFYSSHMLFVGETRAWAFVATLFGPPATLSYDHGQRVVESLWCSVHNPEARCLYRIFLDKSSPAHQVFAARIFESTGCDIVFRLLEGTDESIRQLCLDWILRMLLSDSPKHARLRRALVDVPPAVWTGLLRAHPLTDQVYYSLLRMATVSSIAAGKDAKEPTSIATPALDTPTDFSPRISQTGVPERVSTVSMSCDTTQGPPLEDSIASLLVRYPGFVKTMIELLAHCVDIDTGVLSNVWKDMLHLMALPSNLAALRPHLNCYSIIILLGKLALQANALTLATTVSDNPSSPSSSLPLRDNVPPPEMLAVILNLTTQTTDKDIIQANLVDEMLVLFWVLVPSNYADRMIQDWLLLVIDAITKRVESGVQLSDSDYQNLLRFVNTVDEFLFNKQDILDSLKFEYSDAMYNWQLLIQRHRTLHMPQFKKQPSADLAAKTSNPFEENPRLAVAHADLVNRLIQHKDMRPRKGFSFWQPILYPTDDQLSILAIRLLLNAFLSFDRDRWLSASSRLAVVLKSEELAVSDVPRPFALYALAIVYEAFKVQPEPIVDVCLVEALKLWSKVIESSASDITKALIDAACVPADAADARAESLGSGSSLSSFLGGDKWSAFADKHLYPAMRTYEDEWLSGVSNVTKKFTAAARTMLGRFGRDADVDQSVFSPVQQRLATVTGAKVEARTKRLAEKITSYESSTRQVANMWNRKSLELTFDRQIWASASPRSGPTYMKLDTYENHLRMRRRLTRNFDFHDHIDASMKRDKLAPQIASGGPGADARRGVPFMNKPSSLHSLSDRKKMLVDRMQRLQIDSGIRRDGSRASIVSEDDTEDEDWNLIAEEESSSGYDSQTERCVCTASSEMIVYMTSIKGRFEVTTTHLRFFPTVTSGAARPERSPASPSRSFLTPDTNATTDQKWPLSELQQVFLRRYKLHKSGLEFFFLDGHTFLFNFLESNGRRGSSERMRVLRKIIGLRPPSLRPPLTVSPEECMKRSGLTERWVRREITNFEYLMALNTYSGRTYNDLTQYPVFPWVLSDYKSPLIDLTDPSVYRDLTKPIGALNPARLAGFLERYNAFEDPEGQVKKFLYGSHYSSSASVLFYLLRLEPFTTLHVSLQGGKFDHPDRQFHSLASCWYSVFTSSSDVKELIPEFYYCPSF
ncbi:hypothetical protein BC831DRAFT_6016 [Entophlyctis helioformis]|nr:hypothetical protein BC831DRAFT_6016 [Entophlyctis helioformis]